MQFSFPHSLSFFILWKLKLYYKTEDKYISLLDAGRAEHKQWEDKGIWSNTKNTMEPKPNDIR